MEDDEDFYDFAHILFVMKQKSNTFLPVHSMAEFHFDQSAILSLIGESFWLEPN
jgi:hypothetical protein